jgi:hypothetical protein
MRPKDTQFTHTVSNTFFLIMSKSVMLSMLAQGNNGNEILSILDALTSENVQQSDDSSEGADVMEF